MHSFQDTSSSKKNAKVYFSRFALISSSSFTPKTIPTGPNHGYGPPTIVDPDLKTLYIPISLERRLLYLAPNRLMGCEPIVRLQCAIEVARILQNNWPELQTNGCGGPLRVDDDIVRSRTG